MPFLVKKHIFNNKSFIIISFWFYSAKKGFSDKTMKTVIITSTKDSASINIKESLLAIYSFSRTSEKFNEEDIYRYNDIYLCTINKDLIYSENIDKEIEQKIRLPEEGGFSVFIFASKHRSAENQPALTVHPIGNWGNAKYGGNIRTLCFTNAIILKNLFLGLNNSQGYNVTLEATHHGPYIEKPALFIEIGATEKEWADRNAGRIVANAVMNSLVSENKSGKTAFAIGGLHYPSTFNKILLRTDYLIGHICPKYNLENLDEELILQAMEKTTPKSELVILDWKGLGQRKQKIISLLEKGDIRYERSDRILQ